MARDRSPKCKQCRREGMKLFLKGERCLTEKCAVERRSYPPGEHAPKDSKNKDLSLVGDYAQLIREAGNHAKTNMMVLQICWSGVTLSRIQRLRP